MDYTIRKSNRKFKKYAAFFKDGRQPAHFGDLRYGKFKDTTGLGLYSDMDHLDEKRKQLYYARHGKKATLYSAKWFSHRYLWS